MQRMQRAQRFFLTRDLRLFILSSQGEGGTIHGLRMIFEFFYITSKMIVKTIPPSVK